ncbi:hypothetical protein FOZ62_017561, partial [Perkinsus olseni]
MDCRGQSQPTFDTLRSKLHNDMAEVQRSARLLCPGQIVLYYLINIHILSIMVQITFDSYSTVENTIRTSFLHQNFKIRLHYNEYCSLYHGFCLDCDAGLRLTTTVLTMHYFLENLVLRDPRIGKDYFCRSIRDCDGSVRGKSVKFIGAYLGLFAVVNTASANEVSEEWEEWENESGHKSANGTSEEWEEWEDKSGDGAMNHPTIVPQNGTSGEIRVVIERKDCVFEPVLSFMRYGGDMAPGAMTSRRDNVPEDSSLREANNTWDYYFDYLTDVDVRSFVLGGYAIRKSRIAVDPEFYPPWNKTGFNELRRRVDAVGGRILADLGVYGDKTFDKKAFLESAAKFTEDYRVDGFQGLLKAAFKAIKELRLHSSLWFSTDDWEKVSENGLGKIADTNFVIIWPHYPDQVQAFNTDRFAEKVIRNVTQAGVDINTLVMT